MHKMAIPLALIMFVAAAHATGSEGGGRPDALTLTNFQFGPHNR